MDFEALKLNEQLARAFGVPKHCRKAVLTLQVGELPRWDLEVLAIGASEPTALVDPEEVAAAVQRIPFVLRLSREEEQATAQP